MEDIVKDKKILITGGAGFIGSNLAHQLVRKGSEVIILDSMSENYGANEYNIKGIRDEIQFKKGDVRNRKDVIDVVENVDAVFHMAAQLSRPISMSTPTEDIETNCTGTINVLEAIKDYSPSAKMIFASSQAVYGKPTEKPLTENSKVDPIDIYGANKLAGEKYCSVYEQVYDIDTVCFRLANVYGPRAQLENPKYGVINKFIRLSLNDSELTVYKPGDMLRDFVFIDDVIQGLIKGLVSDRANGEVFVLSSGTSTSIVELAEMIVEISGKGEVSLVPWPEDWDQIKIGDVTFKPEKIQEYLNWSKTTKLKNGLEETITFYENNRQEYNI